MEDIKFRGKNKDKWVYGYYACLDNDHLIIQVKDYLVDKEYNIYENKFISFAVDPETVGQYTGLKDKNGKEIYEGDKVKYKNQYDSYTESSGIAIIEIGDHSHIRNGFTGRDTKSKYYITLMSKSDLFSLEIIGNIHE